MREFLRQYASSAIRGFFFRTYRAESVSETTPLEHESGCVSDEVHRTVYKMDIHFTVLCVIWLGGANVVALNSLRRQGLPWYYLLTPVVISKLQGRDWLALLALVILAIVASTVMRAYSIG